MNDSAKQFAHLHVHTDYSFLDGHTNVEAMVKKAAAMGQPAMAITDHGNMCGAIEFYATCEKYNVKPIIGLEAYVAPGKRSEKPAGKKSESYWHLTLLAKNEVGYNNLLELSSKAWLEGYYYNPRIDWELLEEHHEGLICLSGCLGAELAQTLHKGSIEKVRVHLEQKREQINELLRQAEATHRENPTDETAIQIGHFKKAWLKLGKGLETNRLESIREVMAALPEVFPADPEVDEALTWGGYEDAKAVAARFQNLFGEDYYLEVQRHGIEEQENLNKVLNRISSELGIKQVVTNDFHYLHKEDANVHDLMLCIQTGAVVAATERFKFSSNEFFMKSREEMDEMFPDYQEALDETLRIVDKIETINIDMKTLHFPIFPIPEGFTREDYFRHRVYEKMNKIWSPVPANIKRQVDYEVEAINQMGFAPYFLIVEDFVEFCDSHNIMIGPGRGSAPGSAVAYVLGITRVDPFKFHLVDDKIGFTRFLNPLEEYYLNTTCFSDTPPILNEPLPDVEQMQEYVLSFLKPKAEEFPPDRKKALLNEWKTIKAHKLIEPYYVYLKTGFKGELNRINSGIGYVLGMTSVRPVINQYQPFIIFKTARLSMPDIDMDFPDDRRAEVLEYVINKYGRDRVSNIVTFSVLHSRSAIRDVGRALDIPLAKVDMIAKLVPDRLQEDESGGDDDEELHITIKDLLTNSNSVLVKAGAELRNLYQTDKEAQKLLFYAAKLEGVKRQHSVHACGVVITDKPFMHYTAVMQSKNGGVISQLEGPQLEKLGLLKMDFLGLKNLKIIQNTLDLIKKTRGITLDIASVPDGDKETYALLAKGRSLGVFQLASDGMRKYLSALKPKSIFDLSAILALYRPGPLLSGAVDAYVARASGKAPVVYPHESLTDILSDTYGLFVYQEQVMRACIRMANFSPADSDGLRKAMGKKKIDVMQKYQQKYLEGGRANGIDEKTLRTIWEIWVGFASYAFNRSHSIAYAVLSYWTAYAKTHYTVEYMSMLMTADQEKGSVKGRPREVALQIADVRSLGYDVLSCDINRSDAIFLPEGDRAIRPSMTVLKGVGLAAAEAIRAEVVANGPVTSMKNFMERMPSNAANKRIVEALIRAGCFDELHDRAKLLNDFLEYKKEKSKKKQRELLETLDRDPRYIKPRVTPVELLEWELEIAGTYLSGHPALNIKAEDRAKATVTAQQVAANTDRSRDENILVGVLSRVREVPYKSGKGSLLGGKLGDATGDCDIVAFNDTLTALDRSLTVDGAYVVLKGNMTVNPKDRRPQFVITSMEPAHALVEETVQITSNASQVNPEEEIPDLDSLHASLESTSEPDSDKAGKWSDIFDEPVPF